MKPVRLCVFAFALLAVGCCCSGCSWFESACGAAMPVITESQAYVADATVVLDQVEAMFQVTTLPPEHKAQVASAIAQGRVQLREANRLLREASGACSSPDPYTILHGFMQVWALLEPFVMAHSPLGAGAGSQALVPAIVTDARLRAAGAH